MFGASALGRKGLLRALPTFDFERIAVTHQALAVLRRNNPAPAGSACANVFFGASFSAAESIARRKICVAIPVIVRLAGCKWEAPAGSAVAGKPERGVSA